MMTIQDAIVSGSASLILFGHAHVSYDKSNPDPWTVRIPSQQAIVSFSSWNQAVTFSFQQSPGNYLYPNPDQTWQHFHIMDDFQTAP